LYEGRSKNGMMRIMGRASVLQHPATSRGTVLIADDHPLMRTGLRRLLERSGLEVVGEAADGEEAVKLTVAFQPDIALIDLAMPGVGGLEAARQIVGACPLTRVVMLSGHVDPRFRAGAARAGAAGFITKGATFEQMLDILDAVREHRAYLGPPEAGMTIQEPFGPEGQGEGATAFDKLTTREREVLRLVADGHSSASVAAILMLSVRTVETHRLHIMGKLGVHSVAGLTRLALEQGLV
jgi:DNA-binding NarL/FixJ family response regulator